MTRAFVFPGQGSQAVGMGRDLAGAFPAARHLFEEVDEALGQSLTRLMFEGPEDVLTLTENAQPALMAVSMAVVRVLATQGGINLADRAAFVAGHSLGEYSALTAAGALELADSARLLKLRGQAMQAAVPVGEGAMAAVLGLELAQLQDVVAVAAQGQVCATANDNAPGQVVISGNKEAVERAVVLAKEAGAKRAVLLAVSAPFHCSLMAPAALRMEAALAEVAFRAPLVPLMANVTARPEQDPGRLKGLLVEQVTGMVRWRETVQALGEAGVDCLVELGAGKVLSGLTRRIDRDIASLNAAAPADIEALLEELNS